MQQASFNVEDFMKYLAVKDGHETEFLQAVREVVESVAPFLDAHPKYKEFKILERIVLPERIITFRVPWVDDKGTFQVNRAYRIEFNSAIGPYKGGLRFHPSVNQSILKFLGFEQIFKNALTTLPIGGGKGGSDFDPKGKSDNEVMKFCQSFMTELQRHIGPNTDVPAGDIGVGAREIGYMFGQYKRIRNEFTGVLTGKSLNWGGSLIRPEATGYGTVYFVENMLKARNDVIKGKSVLISGSGNVAQYAAQKVLQLGGKVLSLSDSNGTIIDNDGINEEKLAYVMELKNIQRQRISNYTTKYPSAKFFEGKRPWACATKADIALPCATQNEIEGSCAKQLVAAGVKLIAEGANMPSTPEAIKVYQDSNILYAPGKASNAGGVAVSALEMSQNSQKLAWSREEVDSKLKTIMQDIHSQCIKYGKEGANVDYVRGANIAGFVKIADSMIEQGHV